MRILFIHLCGPYMEGYTYRENLLSKYLARHASSLEIITTKDAIDHSNKINYSHGQVLVSVKNVVRLDYRYKFLGYSLFSRIRSFKKLDVVLRNFNPELIYVNSLQFFDLFTITRQKRRNPKLVILGELNSTSENSASSFLSRFFLHKIFYNFIINSNLSYFDRLFYGSGAASQFSSKYYHLPNNYELLPLAVDDDLIEENLKLNKDELKSSFGFFVDDFIITSGG